MGGDEAQEQVRQGVTPRRGDPDERQRVERQQHRHDQHVVPRAVVRADVRELDRDPARAEREGRSGMTPDVAKVGPPARAAASLVLRHLHPERGVLIDDAAAP